MWTPLQMPPFPLLGPPPSYGILWLRAVSGKHLLVFEMVSRMVFESGRPQFLVRLKLKNCFLTTHSLGKSCSMWCLIRSSVSFCHGKDAPDLSISSPGGGWGLARAAPSPVSRKQRWARFSFVRCRCARGCWTRCPGSLTATREVQVHLKRSHTCSLGRSSSTLKDPGPVENNKNITLRSCNESWAVVVLPGTAQINQKDIS